MSGPDYYSYYKCYRNNKNESTDCYFYYLYCCYYKLFTLNFVYNLLPPFVYTVLMFDNNNVYVGFTSHGEWVYVVFSLTADCGYVVFTFHFAVKCVLVFSFP